MSWYLGEVLVWIVNIFLKKFLLKFGLFIWIKDVCENVDIILCVEWVI